MRKKLEASDIIFGRRKQNQKIKNNLVTQNFSFLENLSIRWWLEMQIFKEITFHQGTKFGTFKYQESSKHKKSLSRKIFDDISLQ